MTAVQHIEFLHNNHFEENYHRVAPPPALRYFIDFYWETKFEHLWSQHPNGFSDALFPNIGYTNFINLGTPFTMQVEEKKFNMKTDGFLPRYHAYECFHKPGNHLFGIKFRISPVIFEKKINFAEYTGAIYPISYLLDQELIKKIKKAMSFRERIQLLSQHFLSVLNNHEGSLSQVGIVSKILDDCEQQNNFSLSLEEEAAKYKISLRTLQRYFETCTGISGKKALQVMRIRKAVTQLINDPDQFHYSAYGFYDQSHFYKTLKSFLQKSTLKNKQLHLSLLKLSKGKKSAETIT